jgi:BirA family biotin operon repressor/biotin-[acetyl-CoA-carboxylase] ligase
LWIVAERQTAGRGRHGRAWASEPGNLYATLLLSEAAPAPRAPELAFVAALAVYDAVAEAAPALAPRLMLKWPNDLLCDGAKLAGILIEGEGTAVAIGIGVNCRQHPAATSHPATDLFACGATVSPGNLMAMLSRTMLGRLDQWQRGNAFAAIRLDWLARAHAGGGAIRVRIGAREIAGRFEGIDDQGRLLLRSANGTLEAISAGDVFPGLPLTVTAG